MSALYVVLPQFSFSLVFTVKVISATPPEATFVGETFKKSPGETLANVIVCSLLDVLATEIEELFTNPCSICANLISLFVNPRGPFAIGKRSLTDLSLSYAIPLILSKTGFLLADVYTVIVFSNG